MTQIRVPVFGMQTLEGSIPASDHEHHGIAVPRDEGGTCTICRITLDEWFAYAKAPKNPEMAGEWHDGYRQGWIAAYTLLEGMTAGNEPCRCVCGNTVPHSHDDEAPPLRDLPQTAELPEWHADDDDPCIAPDNLDAAWRACEDVLPDGWDGPRMLPIGVRGHVSRWVASAIAHSEAARGPNPWIIDGTGPTPTAALLDLAEKLLGVA